jgi:hypothetical protein
MQFFHYLYKMNKYLVKYDFQTLITEDGLDQLTNENNRVVTDAIDSAVEEVAGYIRHRYDYDQVFRTVIPFSATTAFVVGDRVFWDETAWDETLIYQIGDTVSFDAGTDPDQTDKIYQALEVTVAGDSPATEPTKWELLAENNTFYTCIVNSTGNIPTTVANFTAGDNRNAKIREITIDVVLYNIHSRLSPHNIPDVRRTRYDGFGNQNNSGNALRFLEKVQKGTVTLDLPVITPIEQNSERISYGTSSNLKYNY